MLTAILKIISALFARPPAAPAAAAVPGETPAPPPAKLEPEALPPTTIVVPAPPRAAAAPVSPSAAVAPTDPAVVDHVLGVPDWLPVCRPMTQHFERCYLTAYPDPMSPLGKALQARGLWFKVLAGTAIPNDPALNALSGAPWTCGWGTTGSDVVRGLQWTQAYADSRLEAGLEAAYAQLAAAVHVKLNAQQLAALVDLVYNVGPGRAAHGADDGRDGIVVLASGKPSTLLTKLNAGDLAGCAAQILVWNRAGGAVSSGLQARRAANHSLFLTGEWQ